MHKIIEEMLEVVFSVWFLPRLYNAAYLLHAKMVEPQKQMFLSNTHTTIEQWGYATCS
jgi:hypothetical protein